MKLCARTIFTSLVMWPSRDLILVSNKFYVRWPLFDMTDVIEMAIQGDRYNVGFIILGSLRDSRGFYE